MPAHFSIQTGSRRSTCDSAKLILRGIGSVVITLAIIAGLEVSFASGRSGVEFSGDAPRQVVNRMQKGNRLQQVAAFQLTVVKNPGGVTTPRLPTVDLKLPEGCDALVSSIADDRLARVAARCVS